MEKDQELMVVPRFIWQKIIEEYHDVIVIGHVGVQKIVEPIKRAFWWHGMWVDISRYVQSYPVCQLMESDIGKWQVYCNLFPFQRENWSRSRHTSWQSYQCLKRLSPSVIQWYTAQWQQWHGGFHDTVRCRFGFRGPMVRSTRTGTRFWWALTVWVRIFSTHPANP